MSKLFKYNDPEEPLNDFPGLGRRVFVDKEEALKIFPDKPQSENKKDKYEVIKGSKECLVMDAIPSKECKEYHKNSVFQVGTGGKSYLKRASQ